MLVGLALTALLLQALYPVLAVSVLSWRNSVARTTVHQSARMALEAMERDLRFATIIAWPPPGGADSRVSVRLADSGGKQVAVGFQQGLSSGQNRRTLYRTYGAGRPVPLTQDVVNELKFSYTAPRLLRIELTVADPQTGAADRAAAAIVCLNVQE